MLLAHDDAWDLAWRWRHWAPRLTRGIRLSDADWDDWRYEAIYRLFKIASTWDQRQPFPVYAKPILVRYFWRFLYKLRRYYKRHPLFDGHALDNFQSPPSGTDDDVIDLKDSLGKLPPRTRKIMLLAADSAASHMAPRSRTARLERGFAKIGRDLGISRERVRVLYRQGMQRLKRCLTA